MNEKQKSVRIFTEGLGLAENSVGLLALGIAGAVAIVCEIALSMNVWVVFFLVTKPLVDLTWRWQFLDVLNQRVNLQAILGVLVAILNCLVAVFGRRKPRYSRRVLLLLAVATLSVIVTPSSWGVNELVRLFAGVSFFFTAGLILGEKGKFDRFAVMFLAIVCVPLVLSLFQVAGLLPFEYWDDLPDGQRIGRASGTYQHPGDLIFFLIYAVPLALYRWGEIEKGQRERIFLIAFSVLAALALVFTFHRMGWIVIAVELAVWYASRKQFKRIILGSVVVLVLAAVFSDRISILYQGVTELFSGETDFASGNFIRGRGANWIAFLTSYAQGGPVRWIIGKGGSVAQVSLASIIEYSEDEPHNDYIRILHAYGLAGVCLYLSLLTAFFRESLLLRSSSDAFRREIGRILLCSLVGVLLLSVTMEPMRYPTAVWYLFALSSIACFLSIRPIAGGKRPQL